MILLLLAQLLAIGSIEEQFKQSGYVEIYNENHGAETFDALYASFDRLIEFFQTHPVWKKKLFTAKERFIRSKDKRHYSTDFFGFFDESEREGRSQIAFYYSSHFHEFMHSHYPEFHQIPEISGFFETCFEIQKPYGKIFDEAAAELGLEAMLDRPFPVLFKVIKYLPSYRPVRPHYDGTAFSLLLDSTDNMSLLLSVYKPALAVDDFCFPLRQYPRGHSILLIPGVLLEEFSIYPTPHIVIQRGNVRYAAVAFAMRSDYLSRKVEFSPLPLFKH